MTSLEVSTLLEFAGIDGSPVIDFVSPPSCEDEEVEDDSFFSVLVSSSCTVSLVTNSNEGMS